MDALRRQRYLDALGIEAWVLRGASSVQPEADVQQAPAPDPVEPLDPAPIPVLPETRIEVPADWKGLRQAVATCSACALSQTRQNTVFGVGPEDAPLMVIGEGPGADEDAKGEPFVGAAGQLLDQMLAAIGYSRDRNVFIANMVKCRPPGNRDPKAEEAEACRAYLEQQIRLVRPRLMLALGRVAAQRLLNSNEPLSRMRKNLHHYGEAQTPLLITYHPAYLLRSPREKAKSWTDLKQVSQILAGSIE